MIEVRDARREDADACAAAHIEGWRTGYRHLLPDEFLDAPEFAAQRLERWRAWTWADGIEGARMFVASAHGQVVGFVTCGPERTQPLCDEAVPGEGGGSTGERAEIYAFYLHPDAWGSGAAPALMARCLRHLREAGYPAAVLWVLSDNPRGRAFYEKAGWAPTGRESLFEGPRTAARLAEPLPECEYAIRLH